MDFPGGGSVVKNLPEPANEGDARDMSLIPGLGRFSRGRKWQSTPVFLPGKSHRQRSLAGYSPWGRKTTGHDMSIHKCTQELNVTIYGLSRPLTKLHL